MHFTKLFSMILDSTVWQLSLEAKVVWITMLAMKDRHGDVMASVPGLAKRAGVSIHACEQALECFRSPDPYSRTKSFDGRRIQDIDGGWTVLNHEKYQQMLSVEERREYNRRKQAERRRKLAGEGGLTVKQCQHMSNNVKECQQCQHIVDVDVDVETNTPPAPQGGSAQARDGSTEAQPRKKARSPRSVAFSPPSREEINIEASKIGATSGQVDAFVHYYGANGWRVGRNPMKSWQHALAGWIARDRQSSPEKRRFGEATEIQEQITLKSLI